jgi:hypothetical protein
MKNISGIKFRPEGMKSLGGRVQNVIKGDKDTA